MNGGTDVSATSMTVAPVMVSFSDALRVWAKVGVLSFGGPAAQIALMHRMVVAERRWLSETGFLHALNFCMLLPGPEAMQLATYVGWRLHGWRGGLAAGLLFVLPGAVVMFILSTIYVTLHEVALVSAVFFGIKVAVLAIVLEALLRISRRALTGRQAWLIAAFAFALMFLLHVPFPLVVLAAATWGFLAGTRPAPEAPTGEEIVPATSLRCTARTAALWLAIWLTPLALITLTQGVNDRLSQIGWFFSKLAVVTFGGAYAVLGYMAQEAVEAHGWLTPGQMLDGLGLAETTPGPLILVTQFVAFLAGWGAPHGWPPLAAATIASLVALWATFAPCFLWIFVCAPYLERIQGQPRLAAALSAITAAVVGVIFHLALWFGLRVLFAEVSDRHWGPLTLALPDVATLDWRAAALFILSLIAVFRLKAGILPTLAACAAVGVVLRTIV